ncbi:MAG TPA: PIG-L deacetylase family protein [Bryobacteraceae bacterium]|nr:PIG-L deacetylase family protein [Bryobacteraceae bacterium]
MRLICVGAHPDDCEIEFGGTAVKLAARGDAVKFLSMTNGEAGHHLYPGPKLAAIRKAEAEEAARRLGIAAAEVLDNPDGQLIPSIEARFDVIRQIRAWEADVVITHRPWDYHPDHRYTGQLVQDSAYLVTVPHVCPETPALRHNPVFLHLEDAFRSPVPFRADIAVDIGDVWERKLDGLDAHRSQVYEWLPWIASAGREKVPEDPAARRKWLDAAWTREPSACTRAVLAERYGCGHAERVRHAEAFEISEYGRQLSGEELEEMFPR